MDRLHLMTVFVAVAEEEGFAAGARRLQMSPPAVTRAVAALEEWLGGVVTHGCINLYDGNIVAFRFNCREMLHRVPIQIG